MYYIYNIELYRVDDNDNLMFLESLYSSYDIDIAIANANREIERRTDYGGKRYLVAVRDVYMNEVVYRAYTKKPNEDKGDDFSVGV